MASSGWVAGLSWRRRPIPRRRFAGGEGAATTRVWGTKKRLMRVRGDTMDSVVGMTSAQRHHVTPQVLPKALAKEAHWCPTQTLC
jgi:hypothetical protein